MALLQIDYVPGSPAVYVVSSARQRISLLINTDRDYGYDFTIMATDGAAGTNGFSVYFNDDETATNYDTNYFARTEAATLTGAPNSSNLGSTRTNSSTVVRGSFYGKQGSPRIVNSISVEGQSTTVAPIFVISAIQYRVTNTNLTKVTFVSSSATGWGAGTIVKLVPMLSGDVTRL